MKKWISGKVVGRDVLGAPTASSASPRLSNLRAKNTDVIRPRISRIIRITHHPSTMAECAGGRGRPPLPQPIASSASLSFSTPFSALTLRWQAPLPIRVIREIRGFTRSGDRPHRGDGAFGARDPGDDMDVVVHHCVCLDRYAAERRRTL